MKAKQFTLFHFWTHTYTLFCERQTPNFAIAVNTPAKRAFNTQLMVRIKDYHNFTDEQIKGLILFGYLYNPLDLPELCHYGRFDNLVRCCWPFRQWFENNKFDIIEKGLLATLRMNRPYNVEEDEEINNLLTSYLQKISEDDMEWV